MVKVFATNKDGKIELTKEELERLLNEIWNDEYDSHGTYWWTPPTIATPYYSTCSTSETWWESDKKYNPLICSGGRFCGNCGAYMRGEGHETD